jgi:hypothetical protein
MRPIRALLPLLALLAAPLPAQEGPPPAPAAGAAPLRVAIRLGSRVDGEPEQINSFQYYVWERCHSFGLRADSTLPINSAKMDEYIAKVGRGWEAKQAAAPPASLIIEGEAACDYNNSEFFGQGQAHNYKGKLTVTVKTAAGEVLHTFTWDHSWGRLPTNYTKSQVLREYNDMLFTTLILGVFHLEQVRAGIPPDKQAELKKWEEKQRERILGPLKENSPDCAIAQFLRALADEAGGDKKPQHGQGDEQKKGE